jgi:hypothetical protein
MPHATLANHIEIIEPPQALHLFSSQHNGHRRQAPKDAGHPNKCGHSSSIGATNTCSEASFLRHEKHGEVPPMSKPTQTCINKFHAKTDGSHRMINKDHNPSTTCLRAELVSDYGSGHRSWQASLCPGRALCAFPILLHAVVFIDMI